jgi:hypothetical protein
MYDVASDGLVFLLGLPLGVFAEICPSIKTRAVKQMLINNYNNDLTAAIHQSGLPLL